MTLPNKNGAGDCLLSVDDLSRLFRVSKRTIWRWRLIGRLPAPLRLNRITVRWRASDIEKYLAAWGVQLPAGGGNGEARSSKGAAARGTAASP